MIVTPSVTIRGAAIGDASATYEIRPNVNGNFEPLVEVFGNTVGSAPPDPTNENQYSGTIDWPDVQIPAGDSFSFGIDFQVRYRAAVTQAFRVNFGDVRVCLEGKSLVTNATIAALGGS